MTRIDGVAISKKRASQWPAYCTGLRHDRWRALNHADRWEAFIVDRMLQAQNREIKNQIGCRDPKFDAPYAWLERPLIGRGYALGLQVDDTLRVFENAKRTYLKVIDCRLMTGNRDYLLRFAVSPSSRHLLRVNCPNCRSSHRVSLRSGASSREYQGQDKPWFESGAPD